jgi:hypothetical protein
VDGFTKDTVIEGQVEFEKRHKIDHIDHELPKTVGYCPINASDMVAI